MHELYYAKYTITFDKYCDEFASTYLFKAEEPHNEVHTYRTFQDFFKSVKAHKYPWGIPESNYTYRETTGRFFKQSGVIYGSRLNYEITERNFKNPVTIEVNYEKCSPKVYGYDFFKKNLSMDDFMCFIQEHYGAKALAIAMSDTVES